MNLAQTGAVRATEPAPISNHGPVTGAHRLASNRGTILQVRQGRRRFCPPEPLAPQSEEVDESTPSMKLS